MQETTTTHAPDIRDISELGSSMRQLLKPADHELMADERVRSLVAYVTKWTDDYQRGVDTGAVISMDEIEMLKKTRGELAQILSERLILEDEGGQPASKQQAERMEHVSAAICRIDQVLPHAEGYAVACTTQTRKSA